MIMFCPKCGAKAVDGAVFCQKCGAKLIVEATNASTPEQKVPPKPSHATTKQPPEKKSKLPIILSITAVLFLLFIIIGVIGGRTNSEIAKDTRTTASTKSVNLSQSYSNEMEGFSFQYPSAWIHLSNEELESRAGGDVDDEYPLVFLANETEDLPEEDSYIMVSKATVTQDIIDFLYVDDEQFATGFDNDVSVISTSMTTLDGVPAREITYVESDGIGRQSYFYAIGMTIYRIDFGWHGKSAGDKQRFFDAIIDSYTITATSDGLCFRGIPVDQMFGKSQADIISIFGEPEPSILEDVFVYGDVYMYFYTWSSPEPYLSGIQYGLLEDYTYNGRAFTDDAQKIIEIMGREPDYLAVVNPGGEDGACYISYDWDCLGSTASLNITLPADEYSTVSIDTYVYLQYPDEALEGGYEYDYPYDDYYGDGPYDNYYDMPDLPDGFEWVEGPSWDIDSNGFEVITGVIKNVSGETKSYVSISFNLYDYDGYQIDSASDGISNLGAGSSWRFEALVVDDNAVNCEFAWLIDW